MPFNKEEHLIELKNKSGAITKYLPVQWRLVWVNEEQQKVKITILHHFVDPNQIIEKGKWDNVKREYVPTPVKGFAYFLVRVEDDWGKVGEAPGSESAADFDDYIEKAHTKAVGRALALIGYGTQFAGPELDEEHRIVDAPVDTSSSLSSDPAPTIQPVQAQQRTAPTAITKPTPVVQQAPKTETPVATPTLSLDVEELLKRFFELGHFEQLRVLKYMDITLLPGELADQYDWKSGYAKFRDLLNKWIVSDIRKRWLSDPILKEQVFFIASKVSGIITKISEQEIKNIMAQDEDMHDKKVSQLTAGEADRFISYYKSGHLDKTTGTFLFDIPEAFRRKKAA